jgi:methylated-DNA-[protein]-cysteine S-methyltransferase
MTTHNVELKSSAWLSPRRPMDEDHRLGALHTRLASEAGDRGLLDVAYRTLASPVGELLLAATERGLVRVAYLNAGEGAGAGVASGRDAILAELSRKVSPRVLAAPARLDRVARELEEYFSGERRSFDLALDLRLTRGFRREVVRRLPDIGFGATASYAQAAASAGSPRAVRAAGTACALNPLPIVLPCHRVVRDGGGTGRYAGGPQAKRLLLDLEAGAAR